MSQGLMPAEIAILQSRFQAGADGHRQQVKFTRKQYAATTLTEFHDVRVGIHATSGMPALLFWAKDAADSKHHVWFVPYISQTQTEQAYRVDIGENSTGLGGGIRDELGLVHFNSVWWAFYRDVTADRLRYRTSADGRTWSASTAIPGLDYAFATWQATDAIVPPEKDAIYLFVPKSGTDASLPEINYLKWTGGVWSAAASSGLIAGRGFGYQESAILRVAKTTTRWCALTMEGGVVSLSILVKTTTVLGGAWTSAQWANTGSLIFGKEGFYGFDLAVRSDGVTLEGVWSDWGEGVAADNTFQRKTSTDGGLSWSGFIAESDRTFLPDGADFPDVAWVPAFDGGTGALWAWGHPINQGPTWPSSWSTEIGFIKLASGILNADSAFGANQAVNPIGDTSVDISDRVVRISYDKAVTMDSDSFGVDLSNAYTPRDAAHPEAGAVSVHDLTAAYHAYMRPNVKVEVWQWHGDVANKVKTFTGKISAIREDPDSGITTVTGIDLAKDMMRIPVRTVAPQQLSQPGYVRDMANFVYLNKNLGQVLTDLLDKAGWPAGDRVLNSPPNYFRELSFQDGISLWDAARQACAMVGYRCWIDELGRFIDEPIAALKLSSWTFRARTDIVTLPTDYDDDQTYTRVRLIGRANLGALYLQEQFIWPSPSAGPRAIAYDALTKHVWLLCANKHLYRLDPQANMAVVSDTNLSSWLSYPDSIAVDTVDNHLWIVDNFDSSTGANANRKFRKVDRATPTTTLLGPFTNPDQLPCRLMEYDAGGGTHRLYMTTFTASSQLVRMNKDGTENSRVASQTAFAMGITSDGQGGFLLSGQDQTELFQIDFAGNTVNRIQQPTRNGNELDLDTGDRGVYEVFIENDTIVKYAIAGTPSTAQTATLAEVVDAALESEMPGGRTLEIIDLSVVTIAEAYAVANAKLRTVNSYRYRLPAGVVGNPGLQKNDRITIDAPGQVIAGDWRVETIRGDQDAGPGTFLMVLDLTPYVTG